MAFQIQDIVGEVVAERPVLSRVFDEMGIDYCCGGQDTLHEICRKKGLEPEALLSRLEADVIASEEDPVVDAAAMSLTELADHIEETHHVYLWTELPRLERMTTKVAETHGAANPRLSEICDIFLSMSSELSNHMMKEEKILFPMVRQLDASDESPVLHCGTLADPIRQMESEHSNAGRALESLRELSDDYSAPDWACNTYRAMLDGLSRLEQDLHQHIHKENNILFPRAIKMESERCG